MYYSYLNTVLCIKMEFVGAERLTENSAYKLREIQMETIIPQETSSKTCARRCFRFSTEDGSNYNSFLYPSYYFGFVQFL